MDSCYPAPGWREERRSAEALRPGKLRGRDSRTLLVLGECLEHAIANRFLRGRVHDGTQEREGAAIAVDDVGAGREGDVAAVRAAALPDAEANQLQAGEW